jgi:hypothetical protein
MKKLLKNDPAAPQIKTPISMFIMRCMHNKHTKSNFIS